MSNDADVATPTPAGVAGRKQVDVVVVGGGAAGLSAASWLGRFRRSVVVMDDQRHRSAQVEHSHGYLGRDPQVPRELLARGREEVLAYPTAEIRQARVEQVRRRDDGLFEVGDDLLAHRLVLACGVQDSFPEVENMAEHYGASVFHCPACDGYEARDRHVVAIGAGSQLVGFARTLENWAASVTVITNGIPFEGSPADRERLEAAGITLLERNIVRFCGTRGDLQGVELEGGQVIATSLVLFSVAHTPRTELAEQLGCELDDEGYVTINDCGGTTAENVYAAGDLVPGLQLTAIAAASGVVAGVACAQSFFGEQGAPGSPTPAPSPE